MCRSSGSCAATRTRNSILIAHIYWFCNFSLVVGGSSPTLYACTRVQLLYLPAYPSAFPIIFMQFTDYNWIVDIHGRALPQATKITLYDAIWVQKAINWHWMCNSNLFAFNNTWALRYRVGVLAAFVEQYCTFSKNADDALKRLREVHQQKLIIEKFPALFVCGCGKARRMIKSHNDELSSTICLFTLSLSL